MRSRSLLAPAPLLSALVAIIAVALSLGLKAVGEHSIEGERTLQAVISELRLQDGLEWRAISERVAPSSMHEQLVASQARSQALITRGDGLGLSAAATRRLSRGQRVYAAHVARELNLLAAERPGEAGRVDEEHVDPAFEAVMGQLDADSRALQRRAPSC